MNAYLFNLKWDGHVIKIYVGIWILNMTPSFLKNLENTKYNMSVLHISWFIDKKFYESTMNITPTTCFHRIWNLF